MFIKNYQDLFFSVHCGLAVGNSSAFCCFAGKNMTVVRLHMECTWK